MFYSHHDHHGHFGLSCLSFIGAFLLGKEFERAMRKHHLFYSQFKNWGHPHHHYKSQQAKDTGGAPEYETDPSSTSYSG